MDPTVMSDDPMKACRMKSPTTQPMQQTTLALTTDLQSNTTTTPQPTTTAGEILTAQACMILISVALLLTH